MKEKKISNIQSFTTREQLFSNINDVLNQTRRRIVSNVNSAVVNAYWQIGRYIVEYEQAWQRPCAVRQKPDK